MKKQITTALALIITGIILGAAPLVSAQTAARLYVNVPFDFVAGHRQLPAGRYTVRRIRNDSETALLILSEDGRKAATVITSAAGVAARQAKLTFRQYGDRHFLAGIWVPGTAGGRELPRSKQERNLRRELSEQGDAAAEPKTVTVLGDLR